jgi:diamine N-acetyltransferase
MNNPIDCEIIRATVDDAQMLSKLGARLFAETFRGTCGDDDLEAMLAEFYHVDVVRAELADPQDFFHLLNSNGVTVGYSRLKAGNPLELVAPGYKAIELKRLYFEKAAHGRGLARQLMLYNLELAKKLGFQRVYLSVWEHNERAKAFYQKIGFSDTRVANPFPIGKTPQTDYWYVLEI